MRKDVFEITVKLPHTPYEIPLMVMATSRPLRVSMLIRPRFPLKSKYKTYDSP